jgi:hypothetical protein
MGYHEDLFRLYKFADPKGYRNLKKTSRRSDNVLLDSGHYSTQAWGALNKFWKGFEIAKSEFDMNFRSAVILVISIHSSYLKRCCGCCCRFI